MMGQSAFTVFVLPALLLAACGVDTTSSGEASGEDARGDEPAPDAAEDAPREARADEVPGEAPPDEGPPDESPADLDAVEDPVAPPECPEASGATVSFSPARPWAGGTVRIEATSPAGYTNVAAEIVGWAGPAPRWGDVEETGVGYLWWWSLDLAAPGRWCVLFKADPGATLYGSAVLEVGDTPPGGTVYKVVENHQWTCEEEITWGIFVKARVEDEAGGGVAGARVVVGHSDCDVSTDHPPPAELVTGGDGWAQFENYSPGALSGWPAAICLFSLRVGDGPSDRAVEISSGLWEENEGCNYCSTYAVNVWGHWSYTAVFRKTASAETCEVPTDHAGQSQCTPTLHFYEPGPCAPL